MKFNYALLTIVIVTLSGCFYRPLTLRRTIPLEQEKRGGPAAITNNQPYPITIWIHGTRLLPRGMFEKFFYSDPGLHHYTFVEPKYKLYAIADAIISSHPDYFMAEGFHLFGWSGKLSFIARREAAETLYEDLKKIRAEYKKRFGKEPAIRIITHSHGGNVALNLAAVRDEDDVDFVIDELILLACPVQMKTAEYSSDHLFKKVYTFYSTYDVIQVIDPQGLYGRCSHVPTFSRRCFETADNVEHIEVQISRACCSHLDFIRQRFLSNIGNIMREIKQWERDAQEDCIDWHYAKKIIVLRPSQQSFNGRNNTSAINTCPCQ